MTPDFMHQMDVKQSDPKTARVCAANPDHGRLTVKSPGLDLTCGNRILEREAKALHENGRPVEKLEGSKVFVCAYTEPIGQP